MFDSAKVLMLSGIGAADELQALGIHIVADLPGVGKNLQDHIFSPLVHPALIPIPPPVPGIPFFHAHLFMRCREGLLAPDLQALLGHLPHYPDGWSGPEKASPSL